MRKILDVHTGKCLYINGMQFVYTDKNSKDVMTYTRNSKNIYHKLDIVANDIIFNIGNDEGKFIISKSSNSIELNIEESIKYIKIFNNEEGTFFQSLNNPSDIVFFKLTSYGYYLFEISNTKIFTVYKKETQKRKHGWQAFLYNGILLKVYNKNIDYGGNVLKVQEYIDGFFSSKNYFDDDYISVKIEENNASYIVKVHCANNNFLAKVGLIM